MTSIQTTTLPEQGSVLGEVSVIEQLNEFTDLIDLLNEELHNPNSVLKHLAELFLKVLNSAVKYIEIKYPNFIHKKDCECFVHFKDLFLSIRVIEQSIQILITIEIETNPNVCWVIRTMVKYKLICNLYNRGYII